MNILHITTFLQGGAGQIIAELASSQSLSGHKVSVATSGTGTQDYRNYAQWIDRLQSARVEVVLVESTFKREIALNVAAFREIRKCLDCSSISVIHTHAAIPSLVALLLRSSAKKFFPIVQTMHGWGIHKSPEQTATDITLMNQLDAVVTTSEASRQLLERLGLASNLINVVPNGISEGHPFPDDARTLLLRQWRAKGFKIMVCLGSVGPRKNQRLLLEAMAAPDAPLNLACALVGEGQEIPALEIMAKEKGLGDRVHFFGYQAEAAQYLANADWLVLPSNDEGLPLSVLEAYRAGIPVLGSDIPEITGIVVPDQTGFIFQKGSLASLVKALVRVAGMPEDKREAMGMASNQLWHKSFSLERMLKGYARIYQEMLTK